MRRARRVVAYAGGAIAAVLVAAVVFVYARSEWLIRRRWSIPASEIAVPGDSTAIARGERLVSVRGCNGCHGARLEGVSMFDAPLVARLVSPNIAGLARRYTTADLERAIRHGVKPNGRSVVVMPADMFYNLSDIDLGEIIAYLRSVVPAQDTLPAGEMRLLARVGLVSGKYTFMAGQIDQTAPRIPAPAAGDAVALGRYIVHTSCTMCHGQDLRGLPGTPDPDEPSPNLSVVAGYTRAEFAHLMRTGEPTGGRTLRLMAETARKRFSHLTDEEVDGVYEYLRSLGANAKGAAHYGSGQ
jgi:mono/diheme cytochrome c family protein